MSDSHSDALVFLGATGDLAYKKVFPAIQYLIQHGHLDVPIIGVAKSGWTVEQLQARARDSLAKHGGGVDEGDGDGRHSRTERQVDDREVATGAQEELRHSVCLSHHREVRGGRKDA